MAGAIVSGAVGGLAVVVLGLVLRRGRGEVGAALRREHLHGLSRGERRQVTRAVRQGRRVEDLRLAPVAAVEARAAAELGRRVQGRGFRLVLAAAAAFWVFGIVGSVLAGDPVLLALALLMLALTLALPGLQRWRNGRTARALAANQSSPTP